MDVAHFVRSRHGVLAGLRRGSIDVGDVGADGRADQEAITKHWGVSHERCE
jgi:hypothetical protein